MAKQFCIPKEKIADMKKAIKSLAKEDQFAKLFEMDDAAQVKFLEKTLTNKEAKLFKVEMDKAFNKKSMRALGDWVKKNLDEKYRSEEVDIGDKKFQNMDEAKAYIEQKAASFAEQKEGIPLTAKEVKKFTELGEKLYQKQSALGEDMGDLVNNYQKNLEFGKAYKEMQDFAGSLMPTGIWDQLVNKLGKAQMLYKPSTIMLNIGTNSILGGFEAIVKRGANTKMFTSVDKNLIRTYRKNNRKLFKETGVDFSRMISLDDTVVGTGKIVGEKIVRGGNKYINAYTDVIFNKGLSTPDVAFGTFAYADSAALYAAKVAKKNGLDPNEVFIDATRIGSKTEEGIAIRTAAVADARFATATNESWSATRMLELRKVLNNYGKFGDIEMPFVATVANFAELSLDVAGLGLIKAANTGRKMLAVKVRKGEIPRDAVRSAMTNLARAGVGSVFTLYLASLVDAEDFMGAYDPARSGIDQLSNSAENSVRINIMGKERWVSVDYLGPFAAQFVGIMYAKKYQKKNENPALGYVLGATSQYIAAMPGFDPLNTISNVREVMDAEQPMEELEYTKDKAIRSVQDTVVSRAVPGFMYDLARATDAYQRDTRQKVYSLKTPLYEFNFDNFVNKIPYLRKNLPVKYDSLGRLMHEQTPVESMLYGSRVKTATVTPAVDEIYRLRNADQEPTIKDLRFSRSSKVDELKEKTGDKFYDVAREYGEGLGDAITKEIATESYKKLTDEEKKDRIYGVGQNLYEETLRKYGIKYGG